MFPIHINKLNIYVKVIVEHDKYVKKWLIKLKVIWQSLYHYLNNKFLKTMLHVNTFIQI